MEVDGLSHDRLGVENKTTLHSHVTRHGGLKLMATRNLIQGPTMHKYRGYQEAEASSVYKGGFSPREEWNSGCTIGLGCEVEDVDVNVEPGESYKKRKKERN